MKILNDNEYKLFREIASLTDIKLKKALAGVLKRKYKKVVETEAYVFAEGDIPIALVAHLDTVFTNPPSEIFYDTRKNVMWSPQGLGADDRAGVYSILQILKTKLRPHIIFTMDEEMGGLGATELAKLSCPFKDLRYIIQLDRRGSNDCVFYDCDNEEFEEYIESFGFITTYGSYSDISELCPVWEIAGVNLSVGYRDEHTYSEILHVGKMLSTINKVIKMLSVNDIPSFKYIPSYPYPYSSSMFYKDGYHGKVEKCERCNRYSLEEDTFPVITQDGKRVIYCMECLSRAAWCNTCGAPFEKICEEQGETGICPICLEEKRNNGTKKSSKGSH